MTEIDKYADRWRFLSEDIATAPPNNGFCLIIRNRWWVVCPNRGLVFFWSRGERGLGSPQCNNNESIAKRLGNNKIFNTSIKFIPLVFVPIDLWDYRQ